MRNREKRLLCKNKSKRISSYIISKKKFMKGKKAKKLDCKKKLEKSIIFFVLLLNYCVIIQSVALMICKSFCRSRDADSEYTKHH